MDKELNAKELVELVSEELFETKKKEKKSQIRDMFLKQEQLTKEVQQLNKELEKKNKSLNEVVQKIEKLKTGDWSVLGGAKVEKEEQSEQE